MMIPTIPSDNLYKALTYLGGLLVAVGLLLPSWERDRFAKDQSAFLKDINALNVQIILAKPPHAEKDDVAKARRAELERLVEQNHESHKAWLRDEVERVQSRTAFAMGALWVGAALAVAGGSLWWFRVQRLVDQQMANDAKQK